MKRQMFAVIAAVTLGATVVTAVFAQTNPNVLIAQRKGAMFLQGKYFGRALAMVSGSGTYDVAAVQRNVDILSVLSQLPWDDFQPHTIGTPNTKAKEDIFKEPAKFKAAVDAYQGELQKLGAAAKTADQASVTTLVKNVGKACNSCHEAFSTIEWRLRVQ